MDKSSKSGSRTTRLEAKAEALYRRILARIEKRIGNTTTDENQLEDVGAELFGPSFRGVFASDRVPRLASDRPYCIANTDREGEAGTHWLALAVYPSTPNVFLYDSFGRPTRSLVPWIRGSGKVVDSDLDAEQRESESNCGQRCLAWLVVFDELGPDAALCI